MPWYQWETNNFSDFSHRNMIEAKSYDNRSFVQQKKQLTKLKSVIKWEKIFANYI